MFTILQMRTPLEIFYRVIEPVFILMIHFSIDGVIGEECHSDQSMHEIFYAPPILPEMNRLIPIVMY